MRARRQFTTRSKLFIEYLEDRTTPAGLVDSLATATPVIGAPIESLNVVSTSTVEDAVFESRLAAAPFAGSVHHIGFGIYNVTLTSGIEVADAVTLYSTIPGVSLAEPDMTIHVNLTPNDTQYSSLYGMAKISAPTAWDTSTGSGNFVVAVIDTGADYNHPDLAANMWHNPAETPGDGVDNDGNGLVDDYYGANFIGANSGDPFDDHGHGTHVSGTIGAVGNNSLGVVGVNWNVKIMALKFLDASGRGAISDAVEALNYAVGHGVKVSNNSWGGGGYSGTMFSALQAAQSAGHIFIAAAGNANTNIDASPSYPASYNVGNVIAVASTTNTDARSGFSNYGTGTVDIAAPGSGIISTTPGNTYSNFSGTSMATPHVAGAVALYWDANPTKTAAEVIAKLLSSADVVPGLISTVGGGRRLNVGAMLQGSSPPPPPTDTTGARVTAAAFSGSTAANLNSVRFTFNEAIDASSFTAADVVTFTGPSGAIVPSSFTVVAASGNTQFDVAFPVQTLTGTYVMIIGPAILDLAGNPMDQNLNGTNGESPADRYTATRTLNAPITQTFSSTVLPLPIRDLQYTRANIAIAQDFSILDVNVRFNIMHTYDRDLVIKLTAPGGQTSTLVNRRGGSSNNFLNTTIDDEASVAISAGAAPFSGTYRPETTLTTFDNTNARGSWTLEVYDSSSQDTGSLTAFSLIITGSITGSSASILGMREGEPFTEPVLHAAPVSLAIPPLPASLAAPVGTPRPVALLLDEPTRLYVASSVGASSPLAPIALPVPSLTSVPMGPTIVPVASASVVYLPPSNVDVDSWGIAVV